MGNAACYVHNSTGSAVTVKTYNMADRTHLMQINSYTVQPGATKKVEAGPDAWGLRISVDGENHQVGNGVTFSHN